MFDVGFSELLIIAVVALLVLGPERLPKAARFAGLWVRRARAQWYSVKAEFERELASEELKRSLSTPLSDLQPQMQALEKELRDELGNAEAGFSDAANELGKLETDLADAASEPRDTTPADAASERRDTKPADAATEPKAAGAP
ncbi:MAG: Sec-independent protein translocase protein TatB [Arenimonas sp.]|jgi:sec-independent protein translocase protein TatB